MKCPNSILFVHHKRLLSMVAIKNIAKILDIDECQVVYAKSYNDLSFNIRKKFKLAFVEPFQCVSQDRAISRIKCDRLYLIWEEEDEKEIEQIIKDNKSKNIRKIAMLDLTRNIKAIQGEITWPTIR